MTMAKTFDPKRWTHNVQIVRIPFPPFDDETHHEKLVAFNRDLEELLVRHDLPREASYLGFYRANADWDNVEFLESCTNQPTRGKSEEGIDNQP